MYIPAAFDRSEDAAWCRNLIARHGFATLVSEGADGAPFASHIPMLWDARGPHGTLTAHMARANPHWKRFDGKRPSLAIFHGPHGYISPAWYAEHPSVPTWNYAVVHATGAPRLSEEADAAPAALAKLVAKYERFGWRFDSLAPDYVARMVRGIVAFEMPIDRLEGKAKMSQNRPAEIGRVIAALEATGDPDDAALAAAMR